MRAIRVGFVLGNYDAGWLGGMNYFRSLVTALRLLPTKRLEPVIFTGTKAGPELIQSLGAVEIVRSALLDNRSLLGLVQRSSRKLFRRDPLLASLLKRNRVRILSHHRPIRAGADFSALGWIPDFQHLHLPEFFSDKERHARDAEFRYIADFSDVLIVSSESARADLCGFAPEAARKSRVLRFVPALPSLDTLPAKSHLEAKYRIEDPYFYVPNQFWIHKNHAVIIDALSTIRKSGSRMKVIASGSTHDPRHPHHFTTLMRRAQDNGVADDFTPLGIIPYPDLIGLMRDSLAVINPSLFEGWSTTVEEAKVIGKSVILSRIPVHVEQSPANGVFFDAGDHLALAQAMLDVAGRGRLPPIPAPPTEARLVFAETYERIVMELADVGT